MFWNIVGREHSQTFYFWVHFIFMFKYHVFNHYFLDIHSVLSHFEICRDLCSLGNIFYEIFVLAEHSGTFSSSVVTTKKIVLLLLLCGISPSYSQADYPG